MPRENHQTFSGNRIEVRVDDRVIGLIQSVRLSDNYGLEDASGIGDIHVVEHVPSKAVHSVSISNMALVRQNLRSELAQMNENGEAVMRALIFDIVILSKGGPGPRAIGAGEILREIIGCSFDSGDVDITAHRITMQSGQFRALDVRGQGL
ncbi:conserved protein of unknown function (plasmid) [Rhodovastum atsumiense]|uniref:Uncharacterized protein n=1 Tax=Rhodovastum atsumiense TaxID=504468 RepID=A0A5M6ITD8_9PROT|nr:hypothetical protein [Rhodovastum atsumiense]KAA5611580.1 hypothetical protein F1189_13530 [Rhodovastum atsumiense]CAH2606337.1 conserved protein of unknown function [Rhodovastum atsumiense]